MELDHIAEKLEQQGLEVVIGLETHIRLNTLTKLFCSCANEEIDRPNQNICSVCTGQMGVLPAAEQGSHHAKQFFLGKRLIRV